MSVSTHLERAESALRRALINALAEGEDHLLTDLFENLTKDHKAYEYEKEGLNSGKVKKYINL